MGRGLLICLVLIALSPFHAFGVRVNSPWVRSSEMARPINSDPVHHGCSRLCPPAHHVWSSSSGPASSIKGQVQDDQGLINVEAHYQPRGPNKQSPWQWYQQGELKEVQIRYTISIHIKMLGPVFQCLSLSFFPSSLLFYLNSSVISPFGCVFGTPD